MPDERDIMLREMAQHRGFKLVKSRRRKAGGDFGLYGLTDAATGQDCFGIGKDGLEKTFEEVEAYLRDAARADWKRALGTAGEGAKPARKKAVEVEAKRERPTPTRHPGLDPGSTSPSDAEGSEAEERRWMPDQVRHDEVGEEVAPSKRKAAKPKKTAPKRAPEPEPEPAPPLVIRDAKASDAKAIATLIDASDGDLAPTLRQLIQSGQAPLVAEEGEVIGVAAWQVLPLLQQAAPLGRITLLRVAEAQRRRGVGRALLEAAEARLADRGCEAVEVLSGIDVGNAHGFFRRLGYERTSYRFARAVAGESSTKN